VLISLDDYRAERRKSKTASVEGPSPDVADGSWRPRPFRRPELHPRQLAHRRQMLQHLGGIEKKIRDQG
jgi:hypothetical protein